ncbi:MAG TPA: NADH-quinone oxidoreductase subunit C/D [Dissulfurispiraceae bacterium]|nr:NADH-quinone oxidoreductase subunit C/D [Dissulfurispiraceae bacterium]
MIGQATVISELQHAFGSEDITELDSRDNVPTAAIPAEKLKAILRYLKNDVGHPYEMLYDLTAVDERARAKIPNPHAVRPSSEFTAIYHLMSFGRNEDIRLKVPLKGEYPTVDSIVEIWPSANWYEREVWDMFGIVFDGHPMLRRILMPDYWQGHPLRKDHPARATDMAAFTLPDEMETMRQEELKFRPEEWGLQRNLRDTDVMFLNLGPQHPGTHGLLRVILELDGEEIVESVLDIGYHHRGAEKMGERQSWHTYIPYTDRIDYLGGVLNNLAYVLSVEKLAGIGVPDRAKVIRIMLCELFRIASHLVWYGTFAQDVGALSPVFYMFTDRERVFDIISAICGGRMHPNWFRIGGVAQDLPRGWDGLIKDFLDYLPARIDEYDRIVMGNQIFRARTKGIGCYTKDEAVEWGVTGPGLRACGLQWDMRKKRPYSGYDQFEFDIPTAVNGDCYDRGIVRIEEMRQSLRIIGQCLNNMPEGPYKAHHPLAVPPLKEHTMHDIETLINHFLGVSWGPVIPPGEASIPIEAAKGINSYYLISDGGTWPYRVRIRAPSFAHLQMVPQICRGLMIPDLMAILGSIDFVLADVDR